MFINVLANLNIEAKVLQRYLTFLTSSVSLERYIHIALTLAKQSCSRSHLEASSGDELLEDCLELGVGLVGESLLYLDAFDDV